MPPHWNMICRTKTKSKIQGSQEESLEITLPWRASSCAWLEHLNGLYAESELLIKMLLWEGWF